MKNIMKQIIAATDSEKDGYCRITHKRGWLDFLEDANLPFTPQELHSTFWEVIDTGQNRPRGDKLLYLRKRYNFTITKDKKPYRTEEALERFITVSNTDDFFNQVPIGGKKESIDIGIREGNSKITFVELKAWQSSDSPIYAIVESLKNLTHYRIIKKRKIKAMNKFDEVEVMILAPLEYYQSYGLLDGEGNKTEDKIKPFQNILNEFSLAFKTKISFLTLKLDFDNCISKCIEIYDELGVKGQQSVSISIRHSIPELQRKNWDILLVSS
ncbi:hypothetical protein ACFL03_09225 [Thermodesulfobacteriota bacterium]